MEKYFLQKQWFRNLFPNNTYILVDNKWKGYDDYVMGEKITDVDGRWNTQFYCKCGNELIQSGSCRETRAGNNQTVWVFKCEHCWLVSYGRPDLIPGVLSCDKHGKPFA